MSKSDGLYTRFCCGDESALLRSSSSQFVALEKDYRIWYDFGQSAEDCRFLVIYESLYKPWFITRAVGWSRESDPAKGQISEVTSTSCQRAIEIFTVHKLKVRKHAEC